MILFKVTPRKTVLATALAILAATGKCGGYPVHASFQVIIDSDGVLCCSCIIYFGVWQQHVIPELHQYM
jgi:hypothetical protein